MMAHYRIRRTPSMIALEELTAGAYVQVGVRRDWSAAQRWLQEMADAKELTVFHRDVFVRTRPDGLHEVMAVAI